MYFYIEVAHTQHRYLSSRDNKIVIHRIEIGLLQQWKLVESGDEDFVFIKPDRKDNLVLLSPVTCDAQATLGQLEAVDQDIAKWRLIPVENEGGNGYVGAKEHLGCMFIVPKLEPNRRGHKPEAPHHELAASQQSTNNNTEVVIFGHKGVGINVMEPRNHMWTIHT